MRNYISRLLCYHHLIQLLHILIPHNTLRTCLWLSLYFLFIGVYLQGRIFDLLDDPIQTVFGDRSENLAYLLLMIGKGIVLDSELELEQRLRLRRLFFIEVLSEDFSLLIRSQLLVYVSNKKLKGFRLMQRIYLFHLVIYY